MGSSEEGKSSRYSARSVCLTEATRFILVLCFLQVLHLPSSGQYLTVSRGGTVGLRHGEDMSPLHTQRLQNAAVAPKDLWVTDAVLLHNANQVTFSLGPDM